MKDNWNKCLEAILHHEGGYVNHPKDPGGETNLGVTKRVYEEFDGTKEMKGDDLPGGLDLCVFDFGVNAGPGRAAKFLQTQIGTVADGGIGPNTLKKLNKHIEDNGLQDTIEEYQGNRQSYYENLKNFSTFGKGWSRRVDETLDLALDFIK